ncbi:hypothetical protein [Amycolatopsis sp. NPDC059021]|uniref:hypothetical protein n=1 Tax=Amycolatopsis sp. NPDC059021 TaxID=3346704 RepID=UPI00366EAC7A
MTTVAAVPAGTVAASPTAVAVPEDMTSRDVAAPPISHVLDGMFKSTPEELKNVAETGCAKRSNGALPQRVCNELTAEQADNLPADLEAQVDELEELVKQDPQARDLLTQPRSVTGVGPGLAKLIGRAAKASKSPAVRQLSDKAGEFADWAGRATTAAGALTTNTVADYAKSAAYIAASFAPGVGEMMSLVEGITTGNVEQSVVAVVGLAGIAIGLAFPPAGTLIAVGVAVYNLSQLLWSFFEARPRDWINDPPGTAEELFESGADIKWTSHDLNGQPVNVVFNPREPVATQTLLLDSKWTKHNRDRQPVTYTLPTGNKMFYYSGIEVPRLDAVVIVWQDGKAHTSTCTAKPSTVGQGTIIVCKDLSERKNDPVKIALGRNAVLEVHYLLTDPDELSKICSPRPRPCALPQKGSHSGLEVLSEGKKNVPVGLPFQVGIS